MHDHDVTPRTNRDDDGVSIEPAPSATTTTTTELLQCIANLQSEILEVTAARFNADDLRTLAEFPAQPHALIHAVVASLHCVSLSLAVQHQSASILHVPAWPLLRIEILTHLDPLWKKIQKRLNQLRRRCGKRLAPAQMRFVAQQVVGPIVALQSHAGSTSQERTATLLATVRRMSTIAEAIAAHVLLCVHYTLVPASTTSSSVTTASFLTENVPVSSLRSLPSSRKLIKQQSVLPPSTPKSHDQAPPSSFISNIVDIPPRRHARGFKYHGRFYLFRASFVPSMADTPVNGEWSVLTLDQRHKATTTWADQVSYARNGTAPYDERKSPPQLFGGHGTSHLKSWCIRCAPIPSSTLNDIQRTSPSNLTFATLLIQAARFSHVFQPPWHRTQYEISMLAPCPDNPGQQNPHNNNERVIELVLKVAIAEFTTEKLFLVGVGAVALHGTTPSLFDLRCKLAHTTTSRAAKALLLSASPFRFLVRGVLLPVAQEARCLAADLLPFAVICSAVGTNRDVHHNQRPSLQSAAKTVGILWQLHREVSMALSNVSFPTDLHVLPNEPAKPHTSETIIHASFHSMQQPLTERVTKVTISSSHILSPSAVNTLIDLFINWRSFESLQHMQLSASIYQLPKKQATHRKRRPLEDYDDTNDDPQNASLRPGPTLDEIEKSQLPHRRYRDEKEYLVPLYATITIHTLTTATLHTPFPTELLALFTDNDDSGTKGHPQRFLVGTECQVLHIAIVPSHVNPCPACQVDPTRVDILLHDFMVEYQRDTSCTTDTLLSLRSAYVWRIAPLYTSSEAADAIKSRNKARKEGRLVRELAPSPPPRWLRDVYRLVTHPVCDFMLSSSQTPSRTYTFFRVSVAGQFIERFIEATFWSRGLNWERHVFRDDLASHLLRAKYTALCACHPPSWAIDSVKFSNFLRECELQPRYLTVGDAAFLFTTHRVTGSQYEMVFEGFLDAIQWIALRVYGEPVRTISDHCVTAIQPAEALRRLCLEWLIQVPSMREIWGNEIHRWRLVEKEVFLVDSARRYAAATRIRAFWLGYHVWRARVQALQELARRRRAATKLQSVQRMHGLYTYHRLLRVHASQIQCRFLARRLLRKLRVERAEYVASMQKRVLKWMKYRLRVLRAWKLMNANWLARRARIQAKRTLRVSAGVYTLDSTRYRFTIYRVPLLVDDLDDENNAITCQDSRRTNSVDRNDEAFDLEVLEPSASWWRSIRITQSQLEQLQTEKGGFRPDHVTQTTRGHCEDPRRKWLRVLAERLHARASLVHGVVANTQTPRSTSDIRVYRNPLDTSNGRLLFEGTIRTLIPSDATNRGITAPSSSSVTDWLFVRVLATPHIFSLLTYSPTSSKKHRWDVTVAWMYRVLQVTHFDGLTLPAIERHQAHDDNVTAMVISRRKFIIRALLLPSKRVLALRRVVGYLSAHGIMIPTYDMLPEVIEERARIIKELEHHAERCRQEREVYLVSLVQANARRLLAIRAMQRVALATFIKEYNHPLRRMIYVDVRKPIGRWRQEQRVIEVGDVGSTDISASIGIYTEKPRMLRDMDVPMPPDEWQLIREDATNTEKLQNDHEFRDDQWFFNPRRGAYSRLNNSLAAVAIQRWFRRVRWVGVVTCSLRHLVHALVFHNEESHVKSGVELLVRSALRLHVLQHDYKAASSLYEAALKVIILASMMPYSAGCPLRLHQAQEEPNNIRALVGLAVLLTFSCQYPAKKSWSRALTLLETAHSLDTSLTIQAHPSKPSLQDIEDYCFCWAMHLHPRNAQALGNYAVFLQCVRHDLDKAEILYRRAIDVDPTNEFVVENYSRLQRERTPLGVYSFAGPGRIAMRRAQEVRRVPDSTWREMEDLGTREPSATRFFHCIRTGACLWTIPNCPD